MPRRFLRLLACLAVLSSPTFAIEQSAAVNVAVLLKTQTTWLGQAIQYPTGPAQVSALMVEIAPGGETGWHLHPVASFGYLIEGELEVQLKEGQVKRIKAGDALAEVVNTLHNGRNVGAGPVKLVVFYAGTVDQVLSVKAPQN